jgi:hypothetical protein
VGWLITISQPFYLLRAYLTVALFNFEIPYVDQDTKMQTILEFGIKEPLGTFPGS